MYGALKQLKKEYSVAINMPDKWRIIREAYAATLPHIMTLSKLNKGASINPYFINFDFTPIEYGVWMIIRHNGLPFYPQFPLLNYFIDFANPFLKIGIEADGKKWHNKEKDRIRDERLSEIGWKIFRIAGSEVWGSQEEDLSVLVMGAINNVYFRDEYEDSDLKLLHFHKLAEFDLV